MVGTKWIVPAVVVRIIDGDTIEVVLDLGWKLYKQDHVRLADINAPERYSIAGKEALAYLTSICGVGDQVMIHSQKLDKYGRCLAIVYRGSTSETLNQMMLDAGHAVPYMVNK